jgi:carbon storage regulator CsrA
MLVLSRKSRESIVVGEPDGAKRMVTVTVLEIREGKVRLGIEADPSIPVRRSEVLQRDHPGELRVGPQGRH